MECSRYYMQLKWNIKRKVMTDKLPKHFELLERDENDEERWREVSVNQCQHFTICVERMTIVWLPWITKRWVLNPLWHVVTVTRLDDQNILLKGPQVMNKSSPPILERYNVVSWRQWRQKKIQILYRYGADNSVMASHSRKGRLKAIIFP